MNKTADVYTKPLAAIVFVIMMTLVNLTAFASGPKVYEKDGNIYAKLNERDRSVKLTNTGKDSEPLLSPDKSFVVFLRDIDEKYKGHLGSERPMHHNQICSIKLDGKEEKILINFTEFQPQKSMKEELSLFKSLKFSSDGRYLYFLSGGAWVTSAALHRYDFTKGKEEFLVPSNGYCLFEFNKCKNCPTPLAPICYEEYENHIITLEHRYYALGGSYDQYFLYDGNGKELGPLQDEVAACLCSPLSR